MGKVRCFACHKTGHYASQCPNKKIGRVGGQWGLVRGQWIISPYDKNEVGVPWCFEDELRFACAKWGAHHACNNGGWMCQIPTKVTSVSGGGWGDVCTKVER
jgi:hypothetical protein